MSSYRIDNTSGTLQIIVHPGRTDGPGDECLHHTTDLTFFGMGSLKWGEGVDQNLFRLLENFACPQKASGDPGYNANKIWPKGPDDKEIATEFLKSKKNPGIKTPITGQIWFNTTNKTPYIFDGSKKEWLQIGSKDFCGTIPVCGTLDFDPDNCPPGTDCNKPGKIKGAKIEECYLCGETSIAGTLNFSPQPIPPDSDCVTPGIIKGAHLEGCSIDYLCGEIAIAGILDFGPQLIPSGPDCIEQGVIKNAILEDCVVRSTAPEPPVIEEIINDFSIIKEKMSQADAGQILKDLFELGKTLEERQQIASLDIKGVYKLTIEGGPATNNYDLDLMSITKVYGAHFGNHAYLPADTVLLGRFSVKKGMTKEEVAIEVEKILSTSRSKGFFKLSKIDTNSPDVIYVLMADFVASNMTTKYSLIDISLELSSGEEIDETPDFSIIPEDLTPKNEVHKYAFHRGTRMVFVQESAPAGWKTDTSADIDNRMLRMVKGSGNGRGGKNDPWVMRGNEVPRHNHSATIVANGNHKHGVWTGNAGNHVHKARTDAQGNHSHVYRYCHNVALHKPGGLGVSFQGVHSHPNRNTTTAGNHRHNIDMNGAGSHVHAADMHYAGNHTHTATVQNNTTNDANWAPRYINVITCVKE